MASPSPKRKSRRGWLLTLLAALAGVALGIAALLLDGDLRASLAGGSIVCLVTAAICAGTVATETSDSAPIDPGMPPDDNSGNALPAPRGDARA